MRREAPATTFVFTDIEGSTRLLRELGGGYADVLGRVRALLREAIAAAGGKEVDHRGDELFAAFADAGSAVGAVLAAQRELLRQAWPGNAAVRVRIGIHSGSADVGSEGYVGLDVHRAARICSSGHGGQVLLSASAAELVGEVRLQDLGEHELPGLSEPERIFQLVTEDLPSSFPPLRNARPLVPALRVAIADDSVLLREGVARLLEDAGLEVVAQSGTADDLLRQVELHRPDVAVVDIRMPPTHTDEGLRAAREIRERFDGTGVLVLSQYVEPGYALGLLAETAEGVGYLLKDSVGDVDEFAAAVRRVADGGSALDPAVVQALVGRPRTDDALGELTREERAVLELMAEGRSNQAIAERLFLTLRTVEERVAAIFDKLRLPAAPEDHRRVLAVLTYLRSWEEPEEGLEPSA